MATVTFEGLFLNEADDLDDYLYLSPASIDVEEVESGSIEDYAGGRVRYIGSDTQLRKAKIVLRPCTLAQREKLETWPGVTLLYRDTRRRMFFGVASAFSFSEISGANEYARASFTVTEITRSMEV